jgi:uncharacterized damage-inducible protein DinB
MSAEDPNSHHHRTCEHEHAQVLRSGDHWISEQRSCKAKARACRAQSEVDSLFGATREPGEQRQNRNHNSINPQSEKSDLVPGPVQRGGGFRGSEAEQGDREKDDRVQKGDQRTLAGVKDSEVVHLRSSVAHARPGFEALYSLAVNETNSVEPEPWLRGTHQDVPPVARAVLHALELAKEDLERWCGGLSDAELHARHKEIAPVAFHLKHIARSLDRLLTYAEGGSLSERQLAELKSEMDGSGTRESIFAEVEGAFVRAVERVRILSPSCLVEARGVGRGGLPTTVGGLLVHVAEHTQRHVGQAVTTAKVVGH